MLENKDLIEKRFYAVAKSRTFNNILDNFDLRNKSVLDIGCSYGEFLAHFGAGSVGLTISEDEVEYGKSVGLDIRFTNVEEYNINFDNKFDVIFANNIFEHLYSPHTFLVKIKKYIGNTGVLILGVPVIPKIISLLKLKKFRGSLAVSHINFFTKDTLKETVRRAGWKMLESRSFHLSISFLDKILYNITPHIYIIAKLDKNFTYHEKRLKELEGYK